MNLDQMYSLGNFNLDALKMFLAQSPIQPTTLPRVTFNSDPLTHVGKQYAAHIVHVAAMSCNPSSDELFTRAYAFTGYVELFSSNWWREVGHGTMEVLGYVDNQEHENFTEFVDSRFWVTQAMGGGYELQTIFHSGGFIGFVPLIDEGYVGGIVFHYTFTK